MTDETINRTETLINIAKLPTPIVSPSCETHLIVSSLYAIGEQKIITPDSIVITVHFLQAYNIKRKDNKCRS